MKRILNFKALLICALLLFYGAMFLNNALAYDNEVYWSNNRYCWKVGGKYQGNSRDYATAIQECINAAPKKWIHVTCRGNLTKCLHYNDGTGLNFHNNTVGIWHEERQAILIKGRHWCGLINVTLDGGKGWFAVHCTMSNNPFISNVTIKNYGGMGMRIDSHPSRASSHWVSGLKMKNCTFENLGGHGVETFGMKNFDIRNIKARNCGECGVLINKGKDGWIDNVDAYRCCKGGGYAGLRFANDCADCKVGYVKAVECGRGFFTVSNIKNVTVEEVYIRDCTGHAILLQHSDGVGINGGSYNGVALNHYTSKNCWINATDVDNSISTGNYYYLENRGTGMRIDGYGHTSNGDICKQYKNTTHYNAQWKLEKTGDYYYITNRGTGMRIDGWGYTSNGDVCRQYKNTTHQNAQWKFEKTGDYYYITNRATGMRIDGYGQTSNGSYCKQYKNTTHYNAQWKLVSAGSIKSATTENSTEVTSDLNIYPNPSINGNFTVDISSLENTEIVNIEIYSYDGKKVFNQKYSGENRIAVNLSLQEGLYIVVVKHGNQITSKKITVK